MEYDRYAAVGFGGENIRVAGLHVAFMDTDMTANVKGPKASPAENAKLAGVPMNIVLQSNSSFLGFRPSHLEMSLGQIQQRDLMPLLSQINRISARPSPDIQYA